MNYRCLVVLGAARSSRARPRRRRCGRSPSTSLPGAGSPAAHDRQGRWRPRRSWRCPSAEFSVKSRTGGPDDPRTPAGRSGPVHDPGDRGCRHAGRRAAAARSTLRHRSPASCGGQPGDRTGARSRSGGTASARPRPRAPPGRRPRRRRGDRRRRVHGAVDGVLPDPGRARDPHRAHRGERGRVRRQRPQRRMVLRAASPPPWTRSRAAARAGTPSRCSTRCTTRSTRSGASAAAEGLRHRLGQGRDRGPGPDARCSCDRAREDEAHWPLLGLRGRRLPVARGRRGAASEPVRPRSWAPRTPRTARRSTRPSWPAGWPRSWTAAGVRIYEGTPAISDRTGGGAHPVRRRPRAPRRARHGGLHAGLARAPAHGAARLLAHARHRAAARRGLGPGRPCRARDVQRRPAPDHLRAAHRRRPAGVRRSRRALPLRLADRPRPRPRPGHPRGAVADADRDVPCCRPVPRDPPLGRPAGRSPATGTPPAGSTDAPGSRGPAATWATASAPRTSPGGRWPT